MVRALPCILTERATAAANGPRWMVLMAIAQVGRERYALALSGPEATIAAAAKPDFDALVASLRAR